MIKIVGDPMQVHRKARRNATVRPEP
jgi:hypothetical protein